MDIKDKIRYTLKYPHILKLLHLDLRNKKKIKSGELFDILNGYKKIIALASGPSLNLCEVDNQNVYLTTNSSYLYLNKDSKFIHFIKDLGYLKKFLLFGLKYKPLLVVIEIYTHSNGQGMGKNSLNFLSDFFGKKPFTFPVIVTNNEGLFKINSKNYYQERINFMNNNNLHNPDTNSGLMIYGYMVWLSATIESVKNCEMYGLDAGEGGNQYFNGLKTLPNHVAMRDKNKEEMGEFLKKCQEFFPFINNYSYFQNNINKS